MGLGLERVAEEGDCSLKMRVFVSHEENQA
jgi:hypothetical protein